MKRNYKFFDMGTVEFDDENSVESLVEFVFYHFDYYEPAGMDIVTVYDATQHHVVIDKKRKCKDELVVGNNGFCIAYFFRNKFFFAEGGWGHNMIQMDAVQYIENPISVQLRFHDFKNTVVINGNVTLEEIYNFLYKSNYISQEQSAFVFCDMNNGLPELENAVEFYIPHSKNIRLCTACKEFIEPVCFIQNKK